MSKNPQVLIVDDDKLDYQFIEEIILEEIPGIEIDYRNSFDTGIGAIKESEYEIAILDYDLGVKKGNEIMYAIKATGKPVSVIFITGNDNPKIVNELKKAGALEVFHKDKLDTNSFSDLIKTSLKKN